MIAEFENEFKKKLSKDLRTVKPIFEVNTKCTNEYIFGTQIKMEPLKHHDYYQLDNLTDLEQQVIELEITNEKSKRLLIKL